MADINGTPDDDGLVGTPDDDTINGFAGNDVERARAGNDTLNGDDGHDFLVGGDGNDTLNGGTGDDYLRGGEGDDVINGGGGFDRAAFTVQVNNPAIGETGVQTGATVDLNIQGVAQDTGHGMDTLIGIENVSGTTFNDTLIGDANNNWIWGEGGNDNLQGGGGNDLVETDTGNSTLDGGTGNDTAAFVGSDSFTSGVAVSLALQGSVQTVATGSSMNLTNFENLSGSLHDDTLTGDGGDNVLAGNTGNDTLLGGAGNDTLYGDGNIAVDTHGLGYSGQVVTTADVAVSDPTQVDGNDTLDGGAGDDIMNGGGGIDTASFASWTEGVTVGIGTGGNGFATNDLGTENDTLISIENISGSAFNDFINGSNDANTLSGGDGGDALFGRGGDDILLGGNGDDFLRGSDGADILNGGSGFDRVSSFVPSPTSGITFNLNIQGVAQDTGQGMDTLISIENASGTILSDTLIGDNGSNWLWGGSDGIGGLGTGNDTISGNGGDDVIEVGTGNHTLSGGSGIDTLSFLGGHVDITSAGVTYSLALQGAAQATEQGSMITSGFENVSGSLFDDVLTGDSGNNILLGDFGNDILNGGTGNDTLYGDGRLWVDTSGGVGGSGPVALFGEADDDAGEAAGNDTLNGGNGNDTLYGGHGNDSLTGGAGNDIFVIENVSGNDHITDFSNHDAISFSGVTGVDDFSDLTLTKVGNSTVITWGTTDSLTVDGVKPNQLHASDFAFAAAAAAVSQDMSRDAFGPTGYDHDAVGGHDTAMLAMHAHII
jgi:Ca2+-binding RTX toxin-like protein